MTFALFQSAALVIEVDGDIHDLQKEEDERREKVLREMGLRIVRFGNDEVAGNVKVFILHHSSLLFWREKVLREMG